MDLNDVRRNCIIFYVLRDLHAELHRLLERGNRNFVRAEDANRFLILVNQRIGKTSATAIG